MKREPRWVFSSTGTSPSEAEDEQSDAEDGGHSVPEQGGGPAGAEGETEPEGSSQGQQLAGHEIHLEWGEKIKKGQNKVEYFNTKQMSQIHQWESDFGVLFSSFWLIFLG